MLLNIFTVSNQTYSHSYQYMSISALTCLLVLNIYALNAFGLVKVTANLNTTPTSIFRDLNSIF